MSPSKEIAKFVEKHPVTVLAPAVVWLVGFYGAGFANPWLFIPMAAPFVLVAAVFIGEAIYKEWKPKGK